MTDAVNAGGRLDRLPIGRFHHRIIWLIGVGMFFDGFDIYTAGTVLGATLKGGFSTMGQNALFVSATFVGMMVGSFLTGFLGDRYGRRFTYQANLLVFGLASLAAAFAPNMEVLIALRFVIGIGLGAENVVGYSTLTEFVPAQSRGRWLGLMAVFVVTGLPVASLVGWLVIPAFGWRAMFVIGGLGGLLVWYARKSLPESPRWLESVGRTPRPRRCCRPSSARRRRRRSPASARPRPAAAAPAGLGALFAPPLLSRLLVGCLCLVVINTVLYGFVAWLPTFFVKQGLSVAQSSGFALLMGLGAPVGSGIGALTADRWGRKPTIIGASLLAAALALVYPTVSDPVSLTLVGFALTIPIYVLVALLFGIYIPELFPTEVRLRASGLCNTLGRGATVVTPFLVVWLFDAYGVAGVLDLMIGLLVLQSLVVLVFGIETRNRRLEALRSTPAPDGAPTAATIDGFGRETPRHP